MTTDPNLIRCGNCGEPSESHTPCTHHKHKYPRCVVRYCPDWIDEADVFREETEADRQAQWASARGL